MKTQAKVFLVGAGPGDPELLTIKAVKAIGDVVRCASFESVPRLLSGVA